MQSLNDPIRIHVRTRRSIVVCGVLLLLTCAIWSFWPLHLLNPSTQFSWRSRERQSNEAPPPVPLFDQSVFHANLWHTPPVTKAEVVQPTEVIKPLQLQLIGIITKDNIRSAAIYDLDADRLVIVVDGDRIQQHTVKVVDNRIVELTDGLSIHRLTLAGDRT